MNKKKTIIITLAVLIVAIGAWYFLTKDKKTATVWETQKPTTGNISESVTATGTIQPLDTVSVGTQASGIISKIYVDFNSVVRKGQLLAELDPTILQATVNQIKGNLAQMQSQLTYQQQNFSRQKQLYDVGAISKSDYDNAVYSLNAAKAAVSSVNAQLKSAQQNLYFTKIYSPIDGVVLSRNVSEGQTVAASFSTPTLFSIAQDLTKMQVNAAVDEADIGSVEVLDSVSFTVDAYIGDNFKGTVHEIRLHPTSSSNVVTYSTLINANNEDLRLKPGMTANIIIYTKGASNALLIPAKALNYQLDATSIKDKKTVIIPLKTPITENQNYVWVKNGDTITQKLIQTGINDNIHVQITSGLSANEEVITGVSQSSSTESNTTQSSPFMPKRPGSNNSKKSTSK